MNSENRSRSERERERERDEEILAEVLHRLLEGCAIVDLEEDQPLDLLLHPNPGTKGVSILHQQTGRRRYRTKYRPGYSAAAKQFRCYHSDLEARSVTEERLGRGRLTTSESHYT